MTPTLAKRRMIDAVSLMAWLVSEPRLLQALQTSALHTQTTDPDLAETIERAINFMALDDPERRATVADLGYAVGDAR